MTPVSGEISLLLRDPDGRGGGDGEICVTTEITDKELPSVGENLSFTLKCECMF